MLNDIEQLSMIIVYTIVLRRVMGLEDCVSGFMKGVSVLLQAAKGTIALYA